MQYRPQRQMLLQQQWPAITSVQLNELSVLIRGKAKVDFLNTI